MLNYQTWLQTSDVVRMLLVQAQVESAGVALTRYLSTHQVTVDGQVYTGIIKNNIDISESVSLDGSASISFGDIELYNNGSAIDSWLDDIWTNKSVKIFYGGLPLDGSSLTVNANFELIFDGIIEDIDSKSATVLNLKIRDKLQKLNTPVSEALIGNWFQGALVSEATYINQNRNNLKPLVFGEVHNITPVLTDPTLLEYMFHNGAVEQLIEVLDNGVPVSYTTSSTPAIPAGSFRLTQAPAGTITCSVQGVQTRINIGSGTTDSTYTNTASNVIATLLKEYGKTLTYAELDNTSFTNLGAQAVGVYLNDRTNLLQICQDIAKSCGLTLSTSRAGVVKLVKLQKPTSASITITESDFILNSMRISQKPPVISSVKLGFCRNYTVLTGLVTGIPQQHKDLFSKEYLEVLVEDATVKAKYALAAEPVLETGYLIDLAQAQSVATEKLNLFKATRKVLSFTGTSKLLSVQVGDSVSITTNKFGLSGGVFGQVIATRPNWLGGKIELEVLI